MTSTKVDASAVFQITEVLMGKVYYYDNCTFICLYIQQYLFLVLCLVFRRHQVTSIDTVSAVIELKVLEKVLIFFCSRIFLFQNDIDPFSFIDVSFYYYFQKICVDILLTRSHLCFLFQAIIIIRTFLTLTVGFQLVLL